MDSVSLTHQTCGILPRVSTELTTVESSARSYPSTYRDYSPEFKAEVLLAVTINNGNVYKTAKDFGISERIIRYWIEKQTDEVRQIREGRQGPLAEQYEHVARVYLDRALEPEAVAKTSGYYAVVAAKQAIETSQLLKGQPTSITASVQVDDLRELQLAAQSVANSEQISMYEACVRLAEQLADVPELASQLKTWADTELRTRNNNPSTPEQV